MTPSDEIAEMDRVAAKANSGWDRYTKDLEYSSCNLRDDLIQRDSDFIAGIEYCKRTYGTFDQAIELLRSEEAKSRNPTTHEASYEIWDAKGWADWLSNNKPRGVK